MRYREDTIVAVSSGQGRAAVAVLRLSGPQAGGALDQLAGGRPPLRRAVLRRLVEPRSGEPLDEGLVLWFPGPHSATGEDMAELQIHGGRAVVAACLDALVNLPGIRPAEPGEFTRRAFLNGRMDLAAVEGLSDLIEAETEGQRRLALAQATGHLGRKVEAWRSRLVRAMALIEAGIDFVDEADVPASVRAAAREELRVLAQELDMALTDHRGERLREGLSVVIAGLPNSGKSSLLNALAARDVAIVSEEPGTTRDVLEVALDLGGIKVVLADTAGLREAAGRIEAEGIRRAHERMKDAGLIIWVHDVLAGDVPPTPPVKGRLWLVANKTDLAPAPPAPAWARADFAVSALFGIGLEELTRALAAWAVDQAGTGGDHPALVRVRHRSAVVEVADRLRAVLADWEERSDELVAEELRLAAQILGRITGRIDVEDLLDSIFREFCIGK